MHTRSKVIVLGRKAEILGTLVNAKRCLCSVLKCGYFCGSITSQAGEIGQVNGV